MGYPFWKLYMTRFKLQAECLSSLKSLLSISFYHLALWSSNKRSTDDLNCLTGLVVFLTSFILSLNFAIRSSQFEPQSAPGLVFADFIELLL